MKSCTPLWLIAGIIVLLSSSYDVHARRHHHKHHKNENTDEDQERPKQQDPVNHELDPPELIWKAVPDKEQEHDTVHPTEKSHKSKLHWKKHHPVVSYNALNYIIFQVGDGLFEVYIERITVFIKGESVSIPNS